VMVSLAVLFGFALLVLPAGGGAAAPHRCAAFDSQADAQGYFAARGGSPRHGVGRLDPDADGVACERLAAPYVGFPTIAYNGPRDFFYGAISMPLIGRGEFACLYGNPHFANGPRLVRLMRKRPGPDLQISHSVRTDVHPRSGRLIWKVDVEKAVAGHYYAQVAPKVRLHPFGPNACPTFRTRAVELPRPGFSG
jgi:Excalibur calcium-binding domain